MKEPFEEIIKSFGKQVRNFRLKKQMSQAALAKAIDRKTSYISKIEKGLLDIHIDEAYDIAKALDIDIKELFSI